MIEIINKDKCNGCHACYNICPKNCISMQSDEEGFAYPQIDTEKCIDCSLCEKVCPELSPLKVEESEKVALAAINKNENIRLESSSGGIFSLLAEAIINNDGIVFGAALSEDCKSVVHTCVKTIEELDKLRGSKYVQSMIGETYKLAKEYLENGRTVLFSGTPCQISGLYKYCGKEYENLYTCDFICHGVPSPYIWEKYVNDREQASYSKANNISFRNKKKGWKTYSVKFDFKNGTEYSQTVSKDLYLRGFLTNIYLRPSCYDCSFKGLNRPSDITLADFWGIDNIAPQMNDDNGTSLVILHSEKAKKLFSLVENQAVTQPVDLEVAIHYNSAAVKSAVCPTRKRNLFFSKLTKMRFHTLMVKFCVPKPKEIIRKNIGRILRKLKLYKGV